MKRILVLFALVGSSALGQISPPPNPGGGGSGSVTSVGATGTALVNATVTNPTTTPTVILTLPNQPANSVIGNFTGSPAAPVASSTPAFSGVNVSNVPVSQLTSGGLVSPITTGLLGEYHLQESSSASPAADFSGLGNNGTYFGTPTLPGGTLGGMTSAGAGGMDFPASFNTALTFAFYSCLSAQTLNASTVFPLAIGGITVAGTPTNSSLKAFGLMTMAVNTAPALTGALLGKYNYSLSTYTDSTVPTSSQQGSDGCHLFTLVRDTSTDHLYIDGNEATLYRTQGGSSTLTPISGSMGLGMPHYATLPQVAYGFPFPIYYSVVFSGALTATQVNALAGSVQTYEQLRGVIKPPVTFSDAGNQLLFVGDSITWGVQPTAWPRLISTTTPYIVITGTTGAGNNIATPSWKLSDMIQECESRGYGSFNPNSATTVVIWGGTNSMALATGTGQIAAATAYQELRRLVQCYKRRAPRVIVTTMISRVGTGFGGNTMDLLKNQYNDFIRRDYAGADGMWDIASYTNFGADGAATTGNTFAPTGCGGAGCFASDGIHPSASPNGENTVAGLFSNYINWLDSVQNGTRPLLITPATYTEFPDDVAVNANPTGASQTITLPSAMGLVGTGRYIFNIQATGANTVTVSAASGENIDGSTTMLCPNATKCAFRSVLGATLGTSTADSVSGAHWEQFGFSGGGAVSGNATSFQGFAVDPTPPTTGTPVLAYNGTSYIPSAVSGTVVPTATTSVLGIVKPDGTTITISGGTISAAGGGAVSSVFTRTGAVVATTGDYTVAQVTGAAPLASPTFTGTVIASTMNATTYQKGGGGVRFMNTCANITTTTALTYTCSITGGATTNPCFAGPMNAAAALLWSGTASITTPLAPNIPFAAIASGTTLTITFTSGANIQPVVAGALFSAGCSI